MSYHDHAMPVKRSDSPSPFNKYKYYQHSESNNNGQGASRNIMPQVGEATRNDVNSRVYTTPSQIVPGDRSQLSVKSQPEYSRFISSRVGNGTIKEGNASETSGGNLGGESERQGEKIGPKQNDNSSVATSNINKWSFSESTSPTIRKEDNNIRYTYSDSRYNDASLYNYTKKLNDDPKDNENKPTYYNHSNRTDYSPSYVVYKDIGQNYLESQPHPDSRKEKSTRDHPHVNSSTVERIVGYDGYKRESDLIATKDINTGFTQINLKVNESNQAPQVRNTYSSPSHTNIDKREIVEGGFKTPHKSEEKIEDQVEYFSFSPHDEGEKWKDEESALQIPQFTSFDREGADDKAHLLNEIHMLNHSLSKESKEKENLKSRFSDIQERNMILESELNELKKKVDENSRMKEEAASSSREKDKLEYKLNEVIQLNKILADKLEQEKRNWTLKEQALEHRLESLNSEIEVKNKKIRELETGGQDQRMNNRTTERFDGNTHKKPVFESLLGNQNNKTSIDNLCSLMARFFERLQQMYLGNRDMYSSTLAGQVAKQFYQLMQIDSETWETENFPVALSNLSSLFEKITSAPAGSSRDGLSSPSPSFPRDREEPNPPKALERSDSQQSNKLSTGSDRSVIIQERIEIINGKPAKVKYLRREPVSLNSREVSSERKRSIADNGPIKSPFQGNRDPSQGYANNGFNITQKLVEENSRMAEEFSKIKQQNKSLKDKIQELSYNSESQRSTNVSKIGSNGSGHDRRTSYA